MESEMNKRWLIFILLYMLLLVLGNTAFRAFGGTGILLYLVGMIGIVIYTWLPIIRQRSELSVEIRRLVAENGIHMGNIYQQNDHSGRYLNDAYKKLKKHFINQSDYGFEAFEKRYLASSAVARTTIFITMPLFLLNILFLNLVGQLLELLF